jgi:dihydroorotate dehydrogenase (fumarate)
MDITSKYMGLNLKSPLIVSSSHFTSNLPTLELLEKNGAGAVVLKSIFEEQLLKESGRLMEQDNVFFWYPEAINFIKESRDGHDSDSYLELIAAANQRLDIPVIASINCITANEWPQFAYKLEDAGAHAIELNINMLPADDKSTPDLIHQRYVQIIHEVKKHVSIPLSVKLSPYFTNMNFTIRSLSETGIDGLVLFHRNFHPDIDIDKMEITDDKLISSEEESSMAMRWIALMHDKVECDLAAGTGIHDHRGAIKQILAGAKAVMVCSALIDNGIAYLKKMNEGIESWMQDKGFDSLGKFRGIIGRKKDYGAAFERIQYMRRTLDHGFPIKIEE